MKHTFNLVRACQGSTRGRLRLVAAALLLAVGFFSPPAGPAAVALGSSVKDEDTELLKQRLAASLLPTRPRGSGPTSRSALELAAQLKPDGSWADIDYADRTPGNWATSGHLSRVASMARAWRAGDPANRGNAELRTKLMAALDYWLQNDFKNPNWWHNQIGVPRSVGEIMLLMEGETTPAQAAKAVEILDRSSLKKASKGTLTGANLVWLANNQVLRGLIEGSPELVSEAVQPLFGEIHIAGPGQEGIQADFSFHQHGAVLYSGGYGAAFTDDCSRFVEFTQGTRFAPTPEQLAILERYVLDGQQWMIRGRVFDYSVVGREIVRSGKSARGLETAADRLAQLGSPRRKELADFAARLRGDSSVAPQVGNRHFWKSDYMAHHRAGYFTSARMFSTRMANTDSFTNGEGRQSHHIADGAALLYRTGDEYRDIFPVWDWRKVPGTTVEQRPEPLDPRQVRSMGKTRFVGGVSDGTFGMAVMDLARGSLAATKAWFYFDDVFVCLGTGITCASANPVCTSVNQCLRSGNVLAAGRTQPLADGEHALDGARWVEHNSVTYVFPANTRLKLKLGAQTGRWSDIGPRGTTPLSRDVFSLWIDHGANVNGGAYQYAVLPGVHGAQAEGAFRPVEVLSNTPALQAVRHNGLKLLEAAFRQPGKLAANSGWTLSVDQPCLLLLQETVDGVRLSVSNPENKPLTVNIALDRRLTGPGCSSAERGGTFVKVVLPEGEEAGRSVMRALKAEGRRTARIAPGVLMAQTPPLSTVPTSAAVPMDGLATAIAAPRGPIVQAVPRTDPNSRVAHAQLVEKAKKGGIDIYFEGDSITRRWGASDRQYQDLLANWNANFFGWNAANFGWGGDTVQNILWRVQNGELDGVNPKIIVLLAGTNNLRDAPPTEGDEAKVEEVTRSIAAILSLMRQKSPKSIIILMGITPRNDRRRGAAIVPTINRINDRISRFADGKPIRYVNLNAKLADSDGKLFDGVTVDGLHLSVKGYQIWADALKPIFTELLGPPAKTDHAPPPTGDPSAQKPVAPQQ